jgi:hypothetical protein
VELCSWEAVTFCSTLSLLTTEIDRGDRQSTNERRHRLIYDDRFHPLHYLSTPLSRSRVPPRAQLLDHPLHSGCRELPPSTAGQAATLAAVETTQS